MGFFNFLKKNQAESVKFSEIGEWLNKQVEGKQLSQKITRAKQELNALLTDTRKALDELEKARLENENIPLKEKQIMEGHRKIYIQRMRKFLDEINLPDDFSQIGHYNARFSEGLTHFSEETMKNHLVLKQFFGGELIKAIQNMKAIEQHITKLQADIDKEGIELIKEAKIKLKQYQDDLHKKAKFEQENENHQGELEILKKKKEKIDARLQEFKKSPEYNEFKDYIEEKKKSEELVSKIEQELISIFAELNRPLKKYTHNTPQEKLADKYIADPTGALEDDTTLTIYDLLNKMLLDIDTVELKDKQLEKTKDMVQKLTKEFLTDKKRELARLKELNKEFAAKINRNVIALNISENESWLKSLENKIKEWENTIAKTNHELEQINVDYLKQKVKEKLREISKALVIEDDS